MSDDESGGRWLHSGLRRDVCVVVASLDDPTAQRAKSELARRYDERIDPKTFYGAMEALVEAGHLERETEGISDHYALTPAGRRLMNAHFAWVDERLGRGERTESDGDGDPSEDDADAAETP